MVQSSSQPLALSLVMITKNEALYIEACLRSVASVVHEIVVVDSGSTDQTLDILKRFDTTYKGHLRVMHRKWPDDFADQRNFAISQASGRWVLILDADEQIAPEDLAKLTAAIERKNVDAYRLPIRNYTADPTEFGYQAKDGQSSHGYVLTHLHRLFKNNPQFRYQGILHERIEPSLQHQHAISADLDVTIHHYGKLKEKNHGLELERYKFYERHGRKKVERDPRDAQAWWELGVIIQKQKKLLEAYDCFFKAGELSPTTGLFQEYLALVLFQMGKWSELIKQKNPTESPTVQALQLVAKAQSDPSVLDGLDDYRPHLSQMALMIFELSLKFKRESRLDRDRELAMQIFGDTGVVEFLEGAQARRDVQLPKALDLLQRAYEKGWKRSYVELLIVWNQMGAFDQALKFAKGLTRNERDLFESELNTLTAYAEAQLKRHP